jgi:hypothetical protein
MSYDPKHHILKIYLSDEKEVYINLDNIIMYSIEKNKYGNYSILLYVSSSDNKIEVNDVPRETVELFKQYVTNRFDIIDIDKYRNGV